MYDAALVDMLTVGGTLPAPPVHVSVPAPKSSKVVPLAPTVQIPAMPWAFCRGQPAMLVVSTMTPLRYTSTAPVALRTLAPKTSPFASVTLTADRCTQSVATSNVHTWICCTVGM